MATKRIRRAKTYPNESKKKPAIRCFYTKIPKFSPCLSWLTDSWMTRKLSVADKTSIATAAADDQVGRRQQDGRKAATYDRPTHAETPFAVLHAIYYITQYYYWQPLPPPQCCRPPKEQQQQPQGLQARRDPREHCHDFPRGPNAVFLYMHV